MSSLSIQSFSRLAPSQLKPPTGVSEGIFCCMHGKFNPSLTTEESVARLSTSCFSNFAARIIRYAKEKCKDPYPVERYANETKRLLGVLEKRLEGRDFLIEDGYSIADMATFPWVHGMKEIVEATVGCSNFPKVMAWVNRCMERPKTAKGMEVCKL